MPQIFTFFIHRRRERKIPSTLAFSSLCVFALKSVCFPICVHRRNLRTIQYPQMTQIFADYGEHLLYSPQRRRGAENGKTLRTSASSNLRVNSVCFPICVHRRNLRTIQYPQMTQIFADCGEHLLYSPQRRRGAENGKTLRTSASSSLRVNSVCFPICVHRRNLRTISASRP
jgi:hypothetical protein